MSSFIDPNMNPNIMPNMNMDMNMDMHHAMNLGMNPAVNQNMQGPTNQCMNQGLNQINNQDINHDANQGISQGLNPVLSSGMNLGIPYPTNQGMSPIMSTGGNVPATSMNQNPQMLLHNLNQFFPNMVQDNIAKGNSMGPSHSEMSTRVGKPSSPSLSFRSGEALKSTKRRVTRACDHCRKRKIKCDELKNNELNKCSNCIKYNAECSFKNWEENYAASLFGNPNTNAPQYQQPVNNAVTSNPKKKEILSRINTPSISVSPVDHIMTTQATSGKIEKLDRKVSLLFDHLARLEYLMDKMVSSQTPNSVNENSPKSSYSTRTSTNFYARKDSNDNNNNIPSAKVSDNNNDGRVFTTTLLTTQKLKWIIERLSDQKEIDETKVGDIVNPMKQMLSVSLKWHVLQTKKLMDYSSPIYIDGKPKLNPLPSKEQVKRLLENFRATALSSITGLIGLNECLEIADKYFDPKITRHRMSYSDLLLLNVSICSGASVTQVMRASDHQLRKDRYDPNKEELKTIENNTLLNSMYYYNKLSIVNEGNKTIQGVLLLSGYLQTNVNLEVALGVLETGIRYAMETGLNKKSYYEGLTFDQMMNSSSIWWRCCSKDKSFSLMLSRPPMIKDEDMNMFTNTTYLEIIKRLLANSGINIHSKNVAKLNNLNDALNYIINFCEFVPLFISYFVSTLVQIECRVYTDCFSLKSIPNYTFDQNLKRILKLREDLIDWEDQLRPCMNLKSYKQCLSTLYVQNMDGNPALFFEIACYRVLKCHFHYFYLRVIVGLLTTSYLMENQTSFTDSIHNVPNIFNVFKDDTKQSCIKMLELFQTFDYQPYVNDEIMYYFLTGVYALLFYVVKDIDNEENEEIPNMINLLHVTHVHLIGENQESLTSDNMKWNTTVFFYTSLLQQVIVYFNQNHKRAKELNLRTNQYSDMLNRVIGYSRSLKDYSVNQLFKLMKEHSFSPNEAAFQEFENDVLQGTPTMESNHSLQSASITLFTELTLDTLKKLKSNEPLLSLEVFHSTSNTPNLHSNATSSILKADKSLFTVEPDDFNLLVPAYKLRPPPNQKAIKNPEEQEDISLTEDENSNNDDIERMNPIFLDPFWQNNLFYDREFFFSEAVRDNGYRA